MRLSSSVLTFSLIHSVGLASCRWEAGLDGDLDGEIDGEIPKPTPDPLLYQGGFRHGAVLMETSFGHERNCTTRGLTLGARATRSCDPGYVLTCPLTDVYVCCPQNKPVCCPEPATVCCTTSQYCVGFKTCCSYDQVGCTNPEGCCPRGSTCCGTSCCTQGNECRNGECINVALSSLSVESVRSVEAERSRSLASMLSKSSSSAPATDTSSGNSNGNNNVVLVGGAVGGAVGATVLVVIGFLLWKRKRGAPTAPPAGQQPLVGEQPSSQPITPASATFSTNTSYLGGPPVTHAGWHPQQASSVALSQGASPPAAGQPSIASQHSLSPSLAVNTWIERPRVIHREGYGGTASQSHASVHSYPNEVPVNPRELYNEALRASTYSTPGPINMHSSTSTSPVSGSPPPPAPAHLLNLSASDKAGSWQ